MKNLTKYHKEQLIFQNLNLTLKQGEVLSLVGPSGCGKTTFMRCLSGLELITAGEVYVGGENMTDVKPERRPIVLMFQEALLFPHMNVIENITYGLRKLKMKKQERLKKGLEMLEKIELTSLRDRFPNQLSGGQMQRVALARALIINPKLLLLDEPFSSLDPSLRSSIRQWTLDVIKSEGVTAMFVTHDRDEAMMIGDRMVVMENGTFQQIGTPKEIYFSPNNQKVAKMYADGLVVGNQFVRSESLKLTSEKIDIHSLEVMIKGIHYKFGQTLYLVRVIELEQEVMLQSHQIFSVQERAFIHFNSHEVVTFNNEEGSLNEKASL